MPRESLVQVGGVTLDQVGDGAVLAQDGFQVKLRFTAKRLAQVVVEIREQAKIGRDGIEVAQVQPLGAEVADEIGGPGVGEHAPSVTF